MKPTDSIIHIRDLSFGYTEKELILHQINLAIPRASIYGFIGPNGAGKTTTMRLMLGLLQLQSGEIQLFGASLSDQRENILGRIGAIIESPSIYKHLSAYDNLKIACQYLNIAYTRIEEVLGLVKLKAQAHKITKQYSTGMKQRLSLAMALLRDPEILILDEPTNGLDPLGMMEFRALLLELNAAGKTIFLSSHLLSEVEKIATHIGILRSGKLVFNGTIGALEKLRKANLGIRLKLSSARKAKTILDTNTEAIVLDEESLKLYVKDRKEIAQYIEQLVQNGIQVYEVIPQKKDLENIFLTTTSKLSEE